MYNYYKILIIIVLIILIYKNYFNEKFTRTVDYNALTEEQRAALDKLLDGSPTDIRSIAATDMEAILNVTSIIKDGGIPIPKGSIIAYNSTEAPLGWALCDGNEGQKINGMTIPDLRGRFIYGKSNNNNILDSGGSANAVVVSHNHSMNNAGHHSHHQRYYQYFHGNKNYPSGIDHGGDNKIADQNYDGVAVHTHHSGNHKHDINHSGESGTNKNLPPYVVLTYIIKID